MAKSLADILKAARQMATALTDNQAQVAGRGGGPDFVTAGQTKITQLEKLEAEQEALKAALKVKTAELEAAQKDVEDWQREATNVVKLAFRETKEKWVEFGIKASR